MCAHQPPCPSADRPDRDAAHIIAFHPEQGWSLLCNGVILFDDTGELLPDGDGIELCMRLREWSDMPIIVLSAVGEEAQKVRALRAGLCR